MSSKRCELKLFNVKYLRMVCVMLHNLCIFKNDPCKPRWKTHVDEIDLIKKKVNRKENKNKPRDIANKIAVMFNEHADSHGVNADTRNVDNGSKIRLEWTELNVTVTRPDATFCKKVTSCFGRWKPLPQKKKHVLKDVSGVAEPRSLLAIMGASGAGKTTLLNVISRQALGQLRVSGSILVNNKKINSKIKSISAYVRQDDYFIGTLTVKEHLKFQALLRMGQQFTVEEKEQRVHCVMSELGLLKCQDTIIGNYRLRGISGGELKRLAFASEIITDPKLLFVDEPTSGLDSHMAESVILALQRLAKEGRTIICSVHQPSSEVFELFDRLLLLSEGRVAYMGPTRNAIQFFDRAGYPCPLTYNPADHYIRTLAINPGKEEECLSRAMAICDVFHEETNTNMKTNAVEEEEVDIGEMNNGYKENAWTQLKAVLWRSAKALKREPMVTKIKITQAVFIGVLAGLCYLQQENQQAIVRNINGAMFFIIINMSFSVIMSSATIFPTELHVFLKENKIKMYRVDVYFFGRTLAEVPWNILAQFLQFTIVYWMAGLRNDARAFFVFVGILLLMQQVALSFGYFIASISQTPQIASALSPPLTLPLLLFGGFFLQDRSIPIWFIWLEVFSWMKYGFAACQINQWEHFGPIGCNFKKNSTLACVKDGLAVLEINGYKPDDFYVNIWAMVGLAVGFRLVAFLCILLRTYRTK